MPVLKTETAAVAPAKLTAEVLTFTAPKPSFVRARLVPALGDVAARRRAAAGDARRCCWWSGSCCAIRPGATLPPPIKIWTEAYDLIVDPFFVAGPQDIGLGWRVLTSLQRVAIGYGLAGVIGIMLGTLIGQSMWAMRGLDPIFQVLRTDLAARLAADLAGGVPRQPAVGDLRDLHHRGLADHHQHRGRHPQHPAGLPQRRRGAAAQPSRVLLEDHDPVGGALHLHRACASASACPGSPSSPPRC